LSDETNASTGEELKEKILEHREKKHKKHRLSGGEGVAKKKVSEPRSKTAHEKRGGGEPEKNVTRDSPGED